MASLQHLHAQSADYANAADRSDIVETLAAAWSRQGAPRIAKDAPDEDALGCARATATLSRSTSRGRARIPSCGSERPPVAEPAHHQREKKSPRVHVVCVCPIRLKMITRKKGSDQ